MGIGIGQGQFFFDRELSQTVQTQNLVDLTLSGNTAGTLALMSSGTVTIAGGNNITLSQAGNAFTISAFNQTEQTQNRFNLTLSGNTAGALAQISSGTMTLAGGNNITLSQAGNAVTISAASQTVQTQNRFNLTLDGNTAGALAEVSSGTLTLAGGNNITLSQAGNAITISGASGGGGGATNSFWQNDAEDLNLAFSNASLSLFPVHFEAGLTADRLNMFISATGSSASTGSVLLSAAIYTFVNSTSINLASSGSTAVSWSSGTNSATNWGGFFGLRRWEIPINVNITPGQYVVALWMRSSNANGTYSVIGGNTIGAFSGWAGQLTSASRQRFPFQGIYTSSTSAGFPAAIPQVSIIGTAGRAIQIALRSGVGSV